MAFPQDIVTFDNRINPTSTDAPLIAQYQQAMMNGDTATAATILAQITDYNKKIISAAYLNSISQTVNALELFYLQKYSPKIVVSASQPPAQEATDFWFEITS